MHILKSTFTATLLLLLFSPGESMAQESSWHTSQKQEDRPLFTEHISPEEFATRRTKVYDAIGDNAIAVIQGAPSPKGYHHFRQNNEFFYLSGIESPDAYLILNGQTREATVYLYHRKERREYGEGKILSYEDSELIKELSGIEKVGSYQDVMDDLKDYNAAKNITELYTHQSPYEGNRMTRSMAFRHVRDIEENPLDSRPARFQNFIQELEKVAPSLNIQNLDPITDELRKIKSDAEIDLIKKSTDIHAAAIMESMRSTETGVTAYELEAASRYIYWKEGIQDEAYYALLHIGPDAYMNHYHGSVRKAKDGDMILMDYGSYYNYYSSDLGRMWPANGTFNSVQRELYSFYLKFYEAILYNIKIGLTPQEVMQNALKEVDVILKDHEFSKPLYEQAARDFVEGYHERAENPNMGLGHGVGLSVHDVGNLGVPIEPGMVFVIEPQFRVPEERIYIRLEDMIIVTNDGVDIYSDYLPRDIETIEKIMQKDGILQEYPASLKELLDK